jgi:hypothetical protein
MLLTTVLLSIVFSLTGAQLEPEGWTYDTQSTTLLPPDAWSTRFEACGGQRQSPVLLSAATTEACREQELVAFTNGNCTYSNLVVNASKATWGEISLQGCQTPQIQVTQLLVYYLQRCPSIADSCALFSSFRRLSINF